MKTLREITDELIIKAEVASPEEARFYVGTGKKRVPFYEAMVIAKRVLRAGIRGAAIKEVGEPSYIDTVVLTPDGTWTY